MQVSQVQTSAQQKLSKVKASSKNALIANNLASKIVNNMQSFICEGTLQIAPQETDLPLQKKDTRSELEKNQEKLSNILQKKQLIKSELNNLEIQMGNLKLSKLNLSRTVQPNMQNNNKYYKSELTAEDIKKIKKIKSDQKKFQQELQQKTHLYQLQMKKIKEQEEQLRQKQRKERFQIKKQQIQKTIELIQKRKQERLTRIQDEKKAIIQIKNRKKIHEEWESKWKIIQKQQEKKKQQLLQQIRKLRKVSYQQIKQHEKKYQQTIKTQKESRFRNSIVHGNNDKNGCQFYKSLFLQQIQQEQKKQKQLQQIKKNNPKQFLSKIKEYNEKIKTYHKPIVKVTEIKENQKPEDKQNNEARSLSLFQTHQKGNQYMRSVNNQLAEALKKRQVNEVINKQPEKPRYINYLKQLKKPESQHNLNKKTSQMGQIKQILQNQSLTQQQKFFKARLLAEKMEHKNLGRSPKALVQSINAKIQILRQVDI